MEGKIEKQNNRSESSAESLEQLLSPEVVEQVIGKVQDINEPGTAFSIISWDFNLEKLRNIFDNGLIGTHREQEGIKRGQFGNPVDKDAYVRTLKSKKNPDVFFNVVGRMAGGDQTIQDSGFWKSHLETTAVIFDISRYREVTPSKLPDLKLHTFGVYAYEDAPVDERNERNQVMAYPDTGFRLSPRVPPRFLSGVIFSMKRRLSSEEYEKRVGQILEENRRKFQEFPLSVLSYETEEDWVREQEDYKYVEENQTELLLERAKQIVQVMMEVDKNKLDLLIPVYDLHGNLWWPEQISYEEVKRRIAERSET